MKFRPVVAAGLLLAMAFASPLFAFPHGSPRNPYPSNKWELIGKSSGPLGREDVYLDYDDVKNEQMSTGLRLGRGRYLYDLWFIVEQPHQTDEGLIGEFETGGKIDCNNRTMDLTPTVTGYDPNGNRIYFNNPPTSTLGSYTGGTVASKVIQIYCS